MNVIARYGSLVKFTHTVFSLPFALVAYVYALVSTGTPFEWVLLVKIVLCLVLARNAAMGFNRFADRRIDALNSRTAGREVPSGRISPGAALVFVIVNAIAFVAVAAWINRLCLSLSPVALAVVLGYSATKRFTSLSHVVLGLALAIAPAGAYIAVVGHLALFPVLLGGAVLLWVGGFDILYSMQDAEFDRANSLHSIPSRFSPVASAAISIAMHAASAAIVVAMGVLFGMGWLYMAGAAVFCVMLVVQHIVYRPAKIARIGATFGLVNGATSVAYALLAIADMVF